MYMGRGWSWYGFFIGFILILILLSPALGIITENSEKPSVILFLHSYHPTYRWTSDITTGFLEAVGDIGPDSRIAIEYLDWKNYQSDESLQLQKEILSYKYGKESVRLIITADDTALQFILNNRETLFPDVPIVFTGLNGYEELHPDTYDKVTGIVTAINPKETLETMISLFPDTTDIWIVSEETESGNEIRRTIHEATKTLSADIVYHDVGNGTVEEIYNQMERLPPHSLIILGNFSRDTAGKVTDISLFAENIAKHSSVPIFILYDFHSGKGTLGGSIISAKHQGTLAGEMAREILNGRNVNEIPMNLNDSTSYVFDAEVLKKYGISENRIPPDSLLINKKPEVIDVYFRELVTAIVIIIILACSLVVLLYLMHQRRKTEHLMQTFINTLPGYVFFKDIKGRYQIANQRLLNSFKHDSQELIGSTDEDIFPHQLAEEYQKNDRTVITSKKPLYIEEDVEITPGIRIPHSTRKVPFLDEHGQVIGLIGLSVDISELKKAHHALEESSRKYYNLFELGWEAIFLIEKGTGNILEANSAASEMYGYSHDELLKMRYQELSMTQDIIEKINNKKPSEVFSIPVTYHIRRDKSSFPVEIVGRFFEWNGKWVFVAAIRDITERIRDQKALQKATEKINLFNYLTRTTINNQLFILRGYLDFAIDVVQNADAEKYLERSRNAVRAIDRLVIFMKYYQDLGLKPAVWQNVEEVFIYAISHVSMAGITRELAVPGLFIYADPFLEKVFMHLVENSRLHGGNVQIIRIRTEQDGDDLHLIYEDDGVGISPENKEQILSFSLEGKSGIGLILVREILAITGISITETGEYGKGSRFVMRIPKGGYRFEK